MPIPPDRIETPRLTIAWSEAPWDSEVIGAPVLQITRMEIHGPGAEADMLPFERVRDQEGVRLVSCRLPHDRLRESMLLEDRGFRFIEMIYSPEADLNTSVDPPDRAALTVMRARDDDLPVLLEIASGAFRNERFHMDPRIRPGVSDQRYRNWVRSSHVHPSQRLFVVKDAARTVAFFVTEMLSDGSCYWHLTAVAPEAQGQGYGRRAWLAMMDCARIAGASKVRTSVVARNHRVINLYARLGFRFAPPLMTFHWIRGS